MHPESQNKGKSPPLDPDILMEIPPSEPSASQVATQVTRSPRGKIARLPKLTRDKINFMLRDGMEYIQILAQLGDEAKDITPKNVSNWHTSPAYQHWLLEQDWLEKLRADQESAFDLLTDFDVAQFNSGALQLAVTRLFLALRHPETGTLDEQLGGNARTFGALVHALSRACRETTNIQKYRDASAKAASAELKKLDVDRDLSDKEHQLLSNKMDQIFKVRRRKPTEAGNQTPSPVGGTTEAVPASPDRSPTAASGIDANTAPAPNDPIIPSEGLTESSQRSESEQNSRIDQAITPHPEGMAETHAFNPAFEPPIPESQTETAATTPTLQHSITPSPLEHCLECENPLPALLPTGGRPTYFCQNCRIELPPAGNCQKPSVEQCPDCAAKLPRLRPNGERPMDRCHHCGNTLPPPEQVTTPVAAAEPQPPEPEIAAAHSE